MEPLFTCSKHLLSLMFITPILSHFGKVSHIPAIFFNCLQSFFSVHSLYLVTALFAASCKHLLNCVVSFSSDFSLPSTLQSLACNLCQGPYPPPSPTTFSFHSPFASHCRNLSFPSPWSSFPFLRQIYLFRHRPFVCPACIPCPVSFPPLSLCLRTPPS